MTPAPEDMGSANNARVTRANFQKDTQNAANRVIVLSGSGRKGSWVKVTAVAKGAGEVTEVIRHSDEYIIANPSLEQVRFFVYLKQFQYQTQRTGFFR
jgi:hypothetical protein